MQFSALFDRLLWNYCVKTGIVLLGKQDAPTPPSPAATAAAQTETNIATANATAALNRTNTNGPLGGTNWTMRPGADPKNPQPGDWTQNNNLAPAQQQQLQNQNQATQSLNPAMQGLANQSSNNLGQSFNPTTPGLVGSLYGGGSQVAGQPGYLANNPGYGKGGQPPQPGFSQTGQAVDNGGSGAPGYGSVSGMVHPSPNRSWDMGYSPAAGSQPSSVSPGQSYGKAGLPPTPMYSGQSQQANQAAPAVGYQNGATGSQPISPMGQLAQSPGVNNVADALYHKQTAMLDPQFQQSDAALQSRLANQGITQGSDAYNKEMGNAGRTKDFAYGNARDSAILAGGTEDSRQFQQRLASADFANQSNAQGFGQNLQSGQFQNTSRAQAISEAIQRRQMPLNELNSLRNGHPLQMPDFGKNAQNIAVNPTDYAGLVNNNYNAQVGNVNAANAQSSQAGMSAASLAAMYLMFA